jgi:hypothetical protein
MPLQTKIIAGFLIFMTAVAIVAIVFFPSDRTTNIVAVAALMVTTGKTGYDILDKERERRKSAEERREKIIVTPKFGMWESTGHELGVIIYNAGSAATHIASAKCFYRQSEDTKTLEFGSMKYHRTEVIPSKHTAKFRCDALKDALLADLARLPAEDIWIVVETQEGQSVTVDGRDIIAVLNSPPTSQFGE